MEIPEFEVGDLVFYKPSEENRYADGQRQLGVVIRVNRDANPLFVGFPETEIFACEYVVKWIVSGYISTLLPFNLTKLEAPVDKDRE
jgi:hypothetical protein